MPGYSPHPGPGGHSPYPQNQPAPQQQQGYYPSQQGHQSPYAPQHQNSDPAGYPAGGVALGQAMPQGHGQPEGYFPQHGAQGAPEYPPAHHAQSQDSLSQGHAHAQHGAGAGVAGLGAGTDAEAQHKAAWDEYYRLNPDALAAHQAQQAQGQAQGGEPYPAAAQGQEPSAQGYGQSPYPAHPQAQSGVGPVASGQRPGSYYAPQHQGSGGSVENLAHGVQRMGVQ